MSEHAFMELLYGRGAHAGTLACIEDVPFELTGRQPGGFAHSIWQLVWHMNFWMAYDLKRIRGEMLPYPEHASQSWPASAAPPSEAEWRKTVTTCRDLLAEMEILAGSEPGALSRKVEPTHPDHTKRTSSVIGILWQTLVHNSYHIGQVALLRRALGAWPPEKGGDTW